MTARPQLGAPPSPESHGSPLLDSILAPDALCVRFQPIFEIRGDGRRLHALECLVRGPRGTNLEAADVLFEYVRQKREESRVDRACVTAIFKAARRLPSSAKLNVNVHAATLCRDHEFLNHLGDAATTSGIDLERITLEIVKHAPPWEGRSFQNALGSLRHIGVRIALDDVGLGHSSYRMILECRPDCLKLDRHFVTGCHSDRYRRAVLDSVAHLASRLGAQVAAEGVESAADLATVVDAGVKLAQGHLLCPAVAADDLPTAAVIPTHDPGDAAGGPARTRPPEKPRR